MYMEWFGLGIGFGMDMNVIHIRYFTLRCKVNEKYINIREARERYFIRQ